MYTYVQSVKYTYCQKTYTVQFCKNQDIHSYNTRNMNKMHVISVKTNLKKTSVNVSGVRLWDKLGKNIRDSVSLSVFKSKLKCSIIDRY